MYQKFQNTYKNNKNNLKKKKKKKNLGEFKEGYESKYAPRSSKQANDHHVIEPKYALRYNQHLQALYIDGKYKFVSFSHPMKYLWV